MHKTMNRNSNVYTVIYATVLTVLVAILLSAASLGLKEKQKANMDNEKKQQILQSVASKLGKEVTFENAADLWQELKMDDAMFCVNTKGEKVEGKAFDIASKSLFSGGHIIEGATLPVYVANINGVPYRIMSMYGAGLWGPIWGYLSVDPEGKVAGVSFDHDSETAGLGSKIKDDPAFAAGFIGKSIFTDGKFTSVSVTKAGKPANYGGEKVDAITGATKTSDYVGLMIYESLLGYVPFIQGGTTPASCCQKHDGTCGEKKDCAMEGCQKEACTPDACGKEECKAQCGEKAECGEKPECADKAACDACKKAE